jgi:hypothetical protein
LRERPTYPPSSLSRVGGNPELYAVLAPPVYIAGSPYIEGCLSSCRREPRAVRGAGSPCLHCWFPVHRRLSFLVQAGTQSVHIAGSPCLHCWFPVHRRLSFLVQAGTQGCTRCWLPLFTGMTKERTALSFPRPLLSFPRAHRLIMRLIVWGRVMKQHSQLH